MQAVRQSIDQEASRTKNELRAQLNRLRSNASNILQQRDQESEVLENQNQFLLNDFRQSPEVQEDAPQYSNSQKRENIIYLRQQLLFNSRNDCKGVMNNIFSVSIKMMRVMMTVLVMMSVLCVAGAERSSRVITSVTHTTQIHHRVVSTDSDTDTGSMSYVTDQEEVRDSTMKTKQGHELEAVRKQKQCTDIPSLGLLQGNTST